MVKASQLGRCFALSAWVNVESWDDSRVGLCTRPDLFELVQVRLAISEYKTSVSAHLIVSLSYERFQIVASRLPRHCGRIREEVRIYVN